MTNKEFWLKLFSENDSALAAAVILCERFVTDEQLERGAETIINKINWLYEEADEKFVNLLKNKKEEYQC